MKELKLYICNTCGNLVVMVHDSGVIPRCCGSEMTQLIANTTDGAVEKHVPQVCVNGSHVRITVGETFHPMTPVHHIQWIVLLTSGGIYARHLAVTDAPEVEFNIRSDEQVLISYAYCNLHGLWKNDLVPENCEQ